MNHKNVKSKSDLAREAVEKFPHNSKKSIAAYLYKIHPLMFKDLEDARYFVRSVTISHVGRISATHKDIYKGLPKGEKNDFSPFVLKPGSYGVIADVHAPYHDLPAIEISIEHFLKRKIKNIILNGDIIDCYQLSRFEKDPSKRDFAYEIDLLKSFLKELKKDFKVVYKLGNHEKRYQKFMMQKAPEIFKLEMFGWDMLLGYDVVKIDERTNTRVANDILQGLDLITDARVIHAGKLSIIHGDEVYGGSSVNPARGYYLKAKTNILAAHRHQVSEHTGKDINGKLTAAWSMGCLCDLQPEYMPYNEWAHGAAIIEHDGEEFEVNNFKIINGKIK